MFQSLFGTDNWILETEKLMRFVPSLVVNSKKKTIDLLIFFFLYSFFTF